MHTMQAVFYRDTQGREPVDAFIDALPVEVQEEIDYTVGLLNRLGPRDPPLPFPFSSQVEGPLRELRCHYGRALYRILYRRSESLFVLLHILEKRSAKLPEIDIQIARQRWTDFRARMDSIPRRPPRAAGHDAP
ncbi:MAG: type II toxin-antitoxin system RelE/ParE family toxin [Candidatus Dormibacteria bacterium]